MILRSSIGIALLALFHGPCDRTEATPAPSSSAAVTTGGGNASCDLRTAVGYCLDFEGASAKAQAKGNCDSAKNGPLQLSGTYAENACPTAGRIGTCVAVIGGVTTTYRYYGPKMTAASAQQNCSAMGGTNGAGGKFTPN